MNYPRNYVEAVSLNKIVEIPEDENWEGQYRQYLEILAYTDPLKALNAALYEGRPHYDVEGCQIVVSSVHESINNSENAYDFLVRAEDHKAWARKRLSDLLVS